MNTLSAYKNEINALCESHSVKKLYAFGSVLSSNFNSNSDIDLIVDFKDLDIKDYADNYFDLKFSLQNILNRSVDLLELHAVKNPYFKQALDKTKVLVYEG
jgi:predicted nucleotidyltransferase